MPARPPDAAEPGKLIRLSVPVEATANRPAGRRWMSGQVINGRLWVAPSGTRHVNPETDPAWTDAGPVDDLMASETFGDSKLNLWAAYWEALGLPARPKPAKEGDR